jgi:arylsulfatase G
LDDAGFGDLGANWPSTLETTAMNELVASGMRFTDGHAGASVCTPSRAALLTGRLGARTGVATNFQVDSLFGLPLTENTLAELLLPAGYDTAMLGKWHLGATQQYHPTSRGFGSYLGIPYSPDMGCTDVPGYNLPPVPKCPPPVNGSAAAHEAAAGATASEEAAVGPRGLQVGGSPALPLYNTTGFNCSDQPCDASILEQPANITTVSSRYGAAAADYIAKHAAGSNAAPFLLYVAFMHVHVPLAYEPQWTNTSARK